MPRDARPSDPLTALVTEWQAKASELRGWGADSSARVLEHCALALADVVKQLAAEQDGRHA